MPDTVTAASLVYFLTEGAVEFTVCDTVKNVAGRVKLYGRASAFQHTMAHFDHDLEPEKKQDEVRMVYKLLTNGSYFGEGDIIKRRGRMSKAVGLSDCHMYLLSRTVSRV